MERKTIVEERENYTDEQGYATAHTITGFYLEGDEVVFEFWSVACDDADDWNSSGRFPLKNYTDGVQELIRNGYCSIQGGDLSVTGRVGRFETLSLRKALRKYSYGVQVEFHGFNSLITSLRCDVNDLVLK